MMAPDRVPWLPDHVGAAVLRRDESSRDSVAFQSGAARLATLIQAIAMRSAPLLEMSGADAPKNVYNQECFLRRNLEPHSAARDFAKYEMAVDLLLPLLSLAIAKARAELRPRGHAVSQSPEYAKVHRRRGSVPSSPAQLHFDRTAATNRTGHVLATATPGGRPAVIGNVCRLSHTRAFAQAADAAPNSPFANLSAARHRSSVLPTPPD